MSEPLEVVSLCLAGLGAVSTLAVALLGRPSKPRHTPPARNTEQGRLDFGEDSPLSARPEEKVLVEHH